MAKGYKETAEICRKLIADAGKKAFMPVYLLMGKEPYYPDLVCKAIIDNALDDSERDFNQIILYGQDANAESVVTAARRFPMMAERQLVVVKEAQSMRTLEGVAAYFEKPLDSTILVLCLHGVSADKRKALYKGAMKAGVVVDSDLVRDYEIGGWISDYYKDKGISINPEAAALLGESAGTDLSRIAVETDKMLKNMPEGTKEITPEDIERNVGISREFSVFELTRELSYRNSAKALRVAAFIGQSPKFAMPMAVSALFTHFYRILKYGALISGNSYPSSADKVKVLGVNPYFFREYDAAVANYPLKKAMLAVSLLEEYDYKGKGGDAGISSPGELLVELVSKLLNI